MRGGEEAHRRQSLLLGFHLALGMEISPFLGLLKKAPNQVLISPILKSFSILFGTRILTPFNKKDYEKAIR